MKSAMPRDLPYLASWASQRTKSRVMCRGGKGGKAIWRTCPLCSALRGDHRSLPRTYYWPKRWQFSTSQEGVAIHGRRLVFWKHIGDESQVAHRHVSPHDEGGLPYTRVCLTSVIACRNRAILHCRELRQQPVTEYMLCVCKIT